MTVKLLKTEEVAARLRISPSKAYNLVASGKLPAIRFDGTIRIEEKDLEEFMENNKSSGPFSSITK